MGAQSAAPVLINFGAFPGSHYAELVITGQTGIAAASSLVEAWIMSKATSDHSKDEHDIVAARTSVSIRDVVDGTGFTIRVTSPEEKQWGQFYIGWCWNG